MKFIFNPRLKSWVFFLLITISFSLHSQTKTNLEIFKALVDSSISEIFNNESEMPQDLSVTLNLGTYFNVFENQIYSSIQSKNIEFNSADNSASVSQLNYTVENARVEYGEIFRNGFLGEQHLTRNITLEGNYRLKGEHSLIRNFNVANLDTVKFDEVQTLENSSYPFTQGKIPTEPFLSNLFEPLVAIVTAAAVITLFFTVRSK